MGGPAKSQVMFIQKRYKEKSPNQRGMEQQLHGERMRNKHLYHKQKSLMEQTKAAVYCDIQDFDKVIQKGTNEQKNWYGSTPKYTAQKALSTEPQIKLLKDTIANENIASTQDSSGPELNRLKL